jgi:hypothetical protein
MRVSRSQCGDDPGQHEAMTVTVTVTVTMIMTMSGVRMACLPAYLPTRLAAYLTQGGGPIGSAATQTHTPSHEFAESPKSPLPLPREGLPKPQPVHRPRNSSLQRATPAWPQKSFHPHVRGHHRRLTVQGTSPPCQNPWHANDATVVPRAALYMHITLRKRIRWLSKAVPIYSFSFAKAASDTPAFVSWRFHPSTSLAFNGRAQPISTGCSVQLAPHAPHAPCAME